MPKTLIRIILLTLLAGRSLVAADIEFTASVDRREIRLDEVITFTVTIEGTRDFPEVPPPESDGFVIISGPSQSSSFQVINGNVSASKTIQWRLAPIQTGEQTIQSLQLRYRRKTYQTEAITVTVNDRPRQTAQPPSSQRSSPAPPEPRQTQSGGGLFLRAEVPKTTIYKGEELPVSFDLYFQNVRNYAPHKLPDAKGFWTEEFPEKRNPQISNVVVDGVAYKKATLRRLALFPTTTGELSIDPMEISCEVPVARRRSRSAFDDFFDDSFFNDPFFSRTQTVAVQSQPVAITVRELPQAGRPAEFSGAVGSFVIESRIDTLQTSQNQALSLSYVISGSGNINAVKLPPLELPAHVEVFEPTIERQVNNKGKSIRGTVRYDYVLIPRSSGILRIPGLSLAYFDPRSGRYEISTASGYTVKVTAADPAARPRAGFRKEEVSLLGSDIRFIVRDNPRWRPMDATVFRRFWFWGLNLFFGLVIAGSLGFRWWMEKMAADSRLARRRRALSKAQQRLKELGAEETALEDSELCGRLDRVLSGFVSDRLGLPPSGIGPRDIERALSQASLNRDLIEELVSFLERLEEARFLPGERRELDRLELIEQTSGLLVRLSKVI